MNFTDGGRWLYAMVGPEAEKHWSRFDFADIQPQASFSGTDAFCDENGKVNTDFPRAEWTNSFNEAGGRTTVVTEIAFDQEGEMDKLLEMGFQEGFTKGLDNLEKLLAGNV